MDGSGRAKLPEAILPRLRTVTKYWGGVGKPCPASRIKASLSELKFESTQPRAARDRVRNLEAGLGRVRHMLTEARFNGAAPNPFTSKWLHLIRSSLAAFDRPLAALASADSTRSLPP